MSYDSEKTPDEQEEHPGVHLEAAAAARHFLNEAMIRIVSPLHIRTRFITRWVHTHEEFDLGHA